MNLKPTIGLILLRAEWFDSVVALPELVDGVRNDAHQLVDCLSGHFNFRWVWQINNRDSLQACVNGLKNDGADLLVICFQVWAEDFFLRPILEAAGDTPLAVWCYQPHKTPPKPASFVEVLRYSGMVGTFEGLGTLSNLGNKPLFTFGSPEDDRPIQDLITFGRAAKVRKQLRKARFGLLPARNEQMQSTFVDEFRLLTEIGPKVIYLSVSELDRAARNVPQDEVDTFLSIIRKKYIIKKVKPSTLELSARVSLGMANLTNEKKLDVLSLDDISQELHTVLGLRPCLYPPLLDFSGWLWSLEGDLGAATALFILDRLTASACFFLEFWYWNEEENWLIGGHAGVENPLVAGDNPIEISHDYEFAQSDATEGAHFQFTAKPGRCILLQLRCTPHAWQAIAVSGAVLDGGPWLEGYPHAAFRPDCGVEMFIKGAAKVGTTQHWILAYGEPLEEIKVLFSLLKIPLEVL